MSIRLATFFLAYLVKTAAFSASDWEAISSASPPVSSAGAEAVEFPDAAVEFEAGEAGIVPFPAPTPPVGAAAGADCGWEAVGAEAAGEGKAYGDCGGLVWDLETVTFGIVTGGRYGSGSA